MKDRIILVGILAWNKPVSSEVGISDSDGSRGFSAGHYSTHPILHGDSNTAATGSQSIPFF